MKIKQTIRNWLFPDDASRKELLDAIYGRNLFGGKEAGVTVDEKALATHGDVYTCVKILATSIGQLPIVLNKEVDDVKVQQQNTVLSNIFTRSPNFYQTTQEFLEQAISNLALRGNFYCEIVRNRHGNIAQIIPFYRQNSVDVIMLTDGTIQYTYTTNDSKTGIAIKQTFSSTDILHIKMNSYDGYVGLSPLSSARRELGISLATEQHTASIFENDATPRFVLESDQTFGDNLDAFNRMRDSWNEAHKGPKKSGKPALLEYGFKAKPLQMTPVDSQLLEQRILSRAKIASMFGIPVHRLNDAAGSRYGNVEQNNKAFYTDTLSPYITRIESHLNQLLPKGFSVQIDDNKFTRGDSKTVTEVIGKQVSMGLISINEGREAIGKQTIEGGDVFVTQSNNLIFGRWDEYEPPQPGQIAVPPTEAPAETQTSDSSDIESEISNDE